jgi:HEAT repeat protein
MKRTIRNSVLGALVFGATLFASGAVIADSSPKNVTAGRARVYENFDPLSLEEPSSPSTIMGLVDKDGKAVASPTKIWGVLEHGEKVECLSCIPYVGKLLYHSDPRAREISAWWLRRRIFGVFGPGQVYEQTLNTVNNQGESEEHRAYAAEALGEFLVGAGVQPLATAVTTDPSAKVRKSAAHALWRINSQGPNGELATAIKDSDEGVRLEALYAATRINVFTSVDAVVTRISDESPKVRKRAAEALGSFRAKEGVLALIALTAPATESDPQVRAAAVAALGAIGDSQAKDAVKAAETDPNGFVRDAARIAGRHL